YPIVNPLRSRSHPRKELGRCTWKVTSRDDLINEDHGDSCAELLKLAKSFVWWFAWSQRIVEPNDKASSAPVGNQDRGADRSHSRDLNFDARLNVQAIDILSFEIL